tara:strand:+ start:176 stop:1009 length:834 start_codon:yes stop_codon:yes gene_type:complete
VGLGGYLMWTGVAREIWKRTGMKSLPIESHGPTIKMIHSPIFYNNPYIVQPQEKFETVFPLILNNPATNYCKKDTPEKAFHRYDKHIISQVCEAYGINDPQIRCDIFLTENEKIFLDEFRSQIPSENYVTIEPFTKDEYTINKTYPFEKWQIVANEISKLTTVVQIGQKTDKLLNNCINMTGSTTFREAAAIISESKLFIGPEGGLMHAANATGVSSVIVITGFIHPVMTCYPENENIWIGKDHGPCGLKVECHQCKIDASSHDPKEIIEAVKRRLH